MNITPRQQAEFERLSRLQAEKMNLQTGEAPRIDPRQIKKGDAFCPICGSNTGKFHREPDGGVSLQCGGCGYQGPLQDFITPEKYQQLLAGEVPAPSQGEQA